MRKIITKDAYAIRQELKQVSECQDHLQKMVSDLDANGIKLYTEDIMNFCSDPEMFILDRITKDAPITLAGLPLRKDQIFALTEKPSFVDSIVNYANENYRRIKISGFVEYFEIKNSKVIIRKEAESAITERYSYYAEGAQIETLDKYLAARDALRVLKAELLAHGYNPFNTLSDRIVVKNDEFEIEPSFILNLQK